MDALEQSVMARPTLRQISVDTATKSKKNISGNARFQLSATGLEIHDGRPFRDPPKRSWTCGTRQPVGRFWVSEKAWA
jgi:hypothetical protein